MRGARVNGGSGERLNLSSLASARLGALKKQARAMGISEEMLERADDEDEPKKAVMKLIAAEAEQARLALLQALRARLQEDLRPYDFATQQVAEVERARLRKESLGTLKKIALEKGVEPKRLNSVDDEEDPKSVVIEWLIRIELLEKHQSGELIAPEPGAVLLAYYGVHKPSFANGEKVEQIMQSFRHRWQNPRDDEEEDGWQDWMFETIKQKRGQDPRSVWAKTTFEPGALQTRVVRTLTAASNKDGLSAADRRCLLREGVTTLDDYQLLRLEDFHFMGIDIAARRKTKQSVDERWQREQLRRTEEVRRVNELRNFLGESNSAGSSCAQMSEAGRELLAQNLNSIAELRSLDLATMKQMHLDCVDRRLLDDVISTRHVRTTRNTPDGQLRMIRSPASPKTTPRKGAVSREQSPASSSVMGRLLAAAGPPLSDATPEPHVTASDTQIPDYLTLLASSVGTSGLASARSVTGGGTSTCGLAQDTMVAAHFLPAIGAAPLPLVAPQSQVNTGHGLEHRSAAVWWRVTIHGRPRRIAIGVLGGGGRSSKAAVEAAVSSGKGGCHWDPRFFGWSNGGGSYQAGVHLAKLAATPTAGLDVPPNATAGAATQPWVSTPVPEGEVLIFKLEQGRSGVRSIAFQVPRTGQGGSHALPPLFGSFDAHWRVMVSMKYACTVKLDPAPIELQF